MNRLISLVISLLSFFIGLVAMLGGYFLYGNSGVSEGAPGWFLAILGAPTTFFYWIIYKLGLGGKEIVMQYAWIGFLYLLQYQLIAILIYTRILDLSKKKGVILIIAIAVIIVISSIRMWNILGLSGP